MALLDIENCVAFGALAENISLGFVGRDGSARANRREKGFGVELFGGGHFASLLLAGDKWFAACGGAAIVE
jgi:hypothetical protein